MNAALIPACPEFTEVDASALEEARIRALEELNLIDTPESESFDRITRMVGRMLDSPVAAVSLTDRTRQWFKSYVGTAGREIPRVGAPCAEVTRSKDVLHIPDMLESAQFADCILARSGIRFYAGAPLTTRQGHTLGALCVLDKKPRTLSPQQLQSLQDFAAMVMSQIELQHEFGRTEPSSGLPNRHQLYDDLESQKRNNSEGGRTLLLIELADSRSLDDALVALGASMLDALIRTAAGLIHTILGRKDNVYHVGTASLAVLIDDEDQSWTSLVEAIAAQLKQPLLATGIPVTLTAAYGVSPFRLGDLAPQDLLRTAMSAARDARQLELPYAVYSSNHDAAYRRRFSVLRHFGESLAQGTGFHMLYQPRLDLLAGTCRSAEALLRWSHPKLGSVSPGEFVPLAEQTALARPMTRWVLSHAFRQLKQWDDQGLTARLSVNVSARNLEEDDFAVAVGEALVQHSVQPAQVELEFTESALIRRRARVLAQLKEIRGLGVELAIDDFGTGYSSFSYLHELPATIVKLDQSFMRSLADSPRDQVLVQSLITMAHGIGYRVVAEGVEEESVLNFLRTAGCDEIQGYFFARPLAPDQCAVYFAENGMSAAASHLGVPTPKKP